MDQTLTTQPQKRRKRWPAVTGLTIGLVIVVGAIIWHLLQQPGEGIIQAQANPTITVANAAATFKSLKGQTISLEYPSTYALSKMGPKVSYNGTDNFLLAATAMGTSDHIAISVQADTKGLGNDSDYRFRSIQPKIYTATKRIVGNDTAYVFVKTDGGYEQSVFIDHQGYIATISLTSTSPDSSLHDATIDRILQTLTWLVP